jgi:hypothetical protein
LLGVVLAYGVSSAWTGKVALGWGVVAGVLGWTGVQAWWFTADQSPEVIFYTGFASSRPFRGLLTTKR